MSPIDPSIPGTNRGRGLASTQQRTSVNGTNIGRMISTGRNGPSMGNGSRRDQGNATIQTDIENDIGISNCNNDNSIVGGASVGRSDGGNGDTNTSQNRSNHPQPRAGRW